MDEINNTIKKALCFVCGVQNSCDRRREVLEQFYKREFNKFVEEWKQTAHEEVKPVKTEVSNLESELENMELDEIKLADKLLQKARLVRELYKIPSLDDSYLQFDQKSEPLIKDYVNVPTDDDQKEITVVSSFKVRQSKSAPLMNQAASMQKCSQIPQAIKSSSKRSLAVSRSTSCTRTAKSASRCSQASRQCTNTESEAVISKKEFQLYKNLFKDNRSTQACSSETDMHSGGVGCQKDKCSTSDSKRRVSDEKPSGGNKTWKKSLASVKSVYAPTLVEKKHPTRRSFQQALENCNNVLSEKEVQKVSFLSCLWYPFMNSKNGLRLSVCIKCTSAEELKHVYALFHKIQEAMFWLDLFSLIGKEITSHLQNMQDNSLNVSVVCSYIQSIFHEQLQRIPMVATPK